MIAVRKYGKSDKYTEFPLFHIERIKKSSVPTRGYFE